jgi:hypothetical protein
MYFYRAPWAAYRPRYVGGWRIGGIQPPLPQPPLPPTLVKKQPPLPPFPTTRSAPELPPLPDGSFSSQFPTSRPEVPLSPFSTDLYERGAAKQLQRFNVAETNAKNEAKRLYRKGFLLVEEVSDLWCNIDLLREQIDTEIKTTSGKSKNWQEKSVLLALANLENLVNVRIQLIQDFITAFGSTLCLSDKIKVCKSYPLSNCPRPCVVEQSGSAEPACKYPFSVGRNLPNYRGKSKQCPFQPSARTNKSEKPCAAKARQELLL